MVLVAGFDPSSTPAERRRVGLVLAAALLAMSSSAVLVRGMEGASPLAIAAWRTLGAAVLLSPGIARGVPRISRRDASWMVVAGLCLAAHFALWFASLERTTVLRSTVLVCLVPVWTGGIGWLRGTDAPRPAFWAGLALALPGVAALSASGGGGTASLIGDAQALAASVLWAAYLVIGRDIRQRVRIDAYMGLVSLAAAAALWPLALGTGTALTGFPTATWALLVAATLGPQLVGHQGFNYAVRYLPASTVSAIMLLEPVGATVLAAVFLGEIPSALAVAGGVVAVAGIVTAAMGRR